MPLRNKKVDNYSRRVKKLERTLAKAMHRVTLVLSAWAEDSKASPTGHRIANESLGGVINAVPDIDRSLYTKAN